MAELFLRRQLFSAQDHPVHHGIYWFSGKASLMLTPHGSHWSSSRSLIRISSLSKLEDKLFSYGEGSVVDRFFGHKFQRRNKKAASTSG